MNLPALMILLALLGGASWTLYAQEAPKEPSAEDQVREVVRDLEETGESVTQGAKKAAEITGKAFEGEKITLGLGFGLNEIEIRFNSPEIRFNSDFANAVMTDNGSFRPFARLESKENELYSTQMVRGVLSIGYNFAFSLGKFTMDRQEVSSISGDDVGTLVKGFFFGVAPVLFLKLGPLYPESQVFVKFGLGLGLGGLRYEGNIRVFSVFGTELDRVNVDRKMDRLDLNLITNTELQFGDFVFLLQTNFFAGPHEQGTFQFQESVVSAAYVIRF